jgi:hypothetical protein
MTRSDAVVAGRCARLAPALELVVAGAAFGGGGVLLADPSGRRMGLPSWMLDRLPVDSWALPGAALVLCNGVGPTVVAVAALRGQRWPARVGHVAVGTAIAAWPLTETVLYGYPLEGEPRWLRPGIAAIGLAIAGLGLRGRRALRPATAAR